MKAFNQTHSENQVPKTELKLEDFQFMGWWSQDEKDDGGDEPWEKFTLMLSGEEMGDYAIAGDPEFE